MKAKIKGVLQEVAYKPSQDQIEQIYNFYQILAEKNQRMNLTALDQPDDFLEKHLRDSLLLHQHFLFKENTKLIDIGSGAGFPGIPVAIMEPSLSVFLLDSLTKRINFLGEVKQALKLENVHLVNMRAEVAGQLPEYRQGFDYCLSRAVSHLSKLAEYCLPFVKVGGFFIPYKAEKGWMEIEAAGKAIQILGGQVIGIREDEILGAKRIFPLIIKKKGTPKEYPRSSEKISKKAI